MSELWRDIPGYEGRYQVSDHGRVRSVDHRVRLVARGTETTRLVRGRVLKPGPQKSGHLTVALGKGNSKQVHAMVLLAFVGPYPAEQEVLHLDDDPTNNRLGNLEYGTRSQNMQLCVAHGRHRYQADFPGSRWRVRARATA
jgi:hypothetical protein